MYILYVLSGCRPSAKNSENKVTVQDIDDYDQMQESVALLTMLALGNRQIEAGLVQPAAEVVSRLRGQGDDRDALAPAPRCTSST